MPRCQPMGWRKGRFVPPTVRPRNDAVNENAFWLSAIRPCARTPSLFVTKAEPIVEPFPPLPFSAVPDPRIVSSLATGSEYRKQIGAWRWRPDSRFANLNVEKARRFSVVKLTYHARCTFKHQADSAGRRGLQPGALSGNRRPVQAPPQQPAKCRCASIQPLAKLT